MLNTAASVMDNVRIVAAIVVQEGSEGSPVVSDSSRTVPSALGVCVRGVYVCVCVCVSVSIEALTTC